MEGLSSVACPVCTLYLRPGITLENHLTSHPKQKVIEALIRVSQLEPQNKISPNECNPAAIIAPVSPSPVPPNHSFIYQQFMSSSGTQPIINVNPMNQQFVAVPTVFNPQMICSPYIFQQQQQVQIVSAGGNIPPFIPRPASDLFPNTNPAICSSAELTDPLSIPLGNSILGSPSKTIVEDKSVKSEDSVRDSVKEKLNEEDEEVEQIYENSVVNCKTPRPDIIIETDNEQIVSVTITNVGTASPNILQAKTNDLESIIDDDEEADDDDRNKACQTVQSIADKDASDLIDPEEDEEEEQVVLIANETEIYEEIESVQLSPKHNYTNEIENETCVASSSGIQTEPDMNVTVLEMDDINFILPNDFMQNGPSIISKVNDIECLTEARRNDRPQVLMNIGTETITSTKILMNLQEDKCMIEEVTEFDTDDKKFSGKIDEECLSRESLNIHADERMPPRGELSEQESNGASEVGWGSRLYQEGSSGMSTSYDLLARESWEASDCSDSEIPPLQSRIQPTIDYSLDVDDPEQVASKSPTFNFICSTCGATFRCPKERRVHQAKEHATPSTINSSKKVLKKRQARKEKVDNKLDVFVKSEPKFEPKEENEEIVTPETNQEEFEIESKENVLCNTCGEMLPSMKDLNHHNRKVHNIRPPNQNLVCKTCGEPFPSQSKYNEHLKEHPLECYICGKHFYKVPNLRLHIRRHTGIRPHKCDICSKSFFAKQKLQEHLNIHNGSSPVKCNMCDETFRRYSNLVQHRNRHHLNIKKKIKDYICHCGEIYHSKNKLNWHKETHESKPKSCKYCHEKFIHMASLTRHIRRAHNQRYVPEVSRENENVECEICKGVYLKSSLEAHLFTHSGKKQHACPICSKEFTTKWNLKLHKWTHAAPTSKPFKCETCQSAFIRQSDYISHMNSHKSIRPYTCNYCGCKFIRKYNCLRHVREHEEGKSYNCGVCNKSFHRSYYLKEHMRIHSGVRPFSCHICGKTSTTKSNHNKHMKIHHAREPVMTEG